MRLICSILLAGSLFSMSASANPSECCTILPVKDKSGAQDFSHFMARLDQAVKQRDEQSLYNLMSTDIQLDFDGAQGIDKLKKKWQPQADNSALWSELEAILQLGGKIDQKQFSAPYVYSRWPSLLEAYEYKVVTATTVRVRSTPSFSGQVLGHTSHKAVKLLPDPDNSDNWSRVWVNNQLSGYIHNSLLRSPADYRLQAHFNEQQGWQITALVKGD